MPKFVHPMAHQLGQAKEQIEALQNRNKELENEIRRLKDLLRRCKLEAEQVDPRACCLQKARSLIATPSYQRGTVSSRNRSAPTDNTTQHKPRPKFIIVKGVFFRFEDGRLIEQVEHHPWVDPRRGTISSHNKEKPPIRPYDESRPEDSRLQFEDTFWSNSDTAIESTESETESATTPGPVLSPELLDDVAPLTDEMRHMHIPTETGHRLLHKALTLAKIIFHDTAKKHWPELWQMRFPGGYQEVQFGFQELLSCFHGFEGPLKNTVQSEMRRSAYYITTLRNMVCHFGRSAEVMIIENYEEHLMRVYDLAVNLRHEKGAFKAKKLRDRLRGDAQSFLDEIESLEALAQLPESRQWKPHHELTFELLLCRNSRGHIHGQPTSLFRTAERWEELGTKNRSLWRYDVPILTGLSW